MKKEVNKIIMFLGFLVTIVGAWVGVLTVKDYIFNTLNLTVIAVILAFAFVNSSNNVLKNVGYSLSAFVGAIGLDLILDMGKKLKVGMLIMPVGMIIMALATVIYFVVFLLKFFGFVKVDGKNSVGDAPCLWNELGHYKEMLTDGILTEDEFSDLKQKAMENADIQAPSMDDLKKWKKLLDQQIITEEEFAAIKKNIFAK